MLRRSIGKTYEGRTWKKKAELPRYTWSKRGTRPLTREALNEGDVDRLVGLSHPGVEVGSPRGSGQGVRLLRECVDSANVRLESQHLFRRGDTVVVEQSGHWRSTASGEVIGSQTVTTVFGVSGG